MGGNPTALVRAVIAVAVTAVVVGLLVWWQPAGLDPWLKAAHIVAVISWMAGMLYLPRLFVYHAVSAVGSEQSETFKVMERRLLGAIMNPAAAATWIFGLALGWSGGWFGAGWLDAKIGFVIGMTAIHAFYARCVSDFAVDRNIRSQRFYRVMNEVPTLLLIVIVILVVVKPF